MEPAAPGFLLAVDLGLTTRLALFGSGGRLRWYRSWHYADTAALRRAIHRLLGGIPDLAPICVVGGGNLRGVWEHEAKKRGVPVEAIAAETWRARLIYARDRRSSRQAKRKARELARRVTTWSRPSSRPTPAQDASDAILVGLWGVLAAGRLAEIPQELRG